MSHSKPNRNGHASAEGGEQPATVAGATVAGATVAGATGTTAPWELTVPRAVVAGGALLAAMVWSYWPTLREVFASWINEPDYSHGFLVAPIALAFLWFRRGNCPVESLGPSVGGLIALLAVSALRVLAGMYFLQPLDAWTIPLWVASAVWMLFGLQCLRWALPALAFLWFMFPIPFSAETSMSVPLQAVATKVSTACLVMLGQPALAEGNTIWLGEHQMFVEQACSGLRIFVGIFALAFAFVLFSRWTWWQKAMALVAALPIAILANATRIVVTGLLYQWASSDWAKHFSHDLSGVVMIPFAAAIFWLFLIYLDRLFPEVELVSPVAHLVADAGDGS